MPIDVRTYGETGPEVVVLHGGPGAPGSVGGLARALGDAFRVLEPLQRRSGAVPLTVARHVSDLAAVAPPGAALVGWSWGAMLALSYAATYPDRISGLVLVGCGTYDEASRALYHERMRERMGVDGAAQAGALQERIANAQDADERDRLFGRLGELATRAQAYDPLPSDDDDLPFDGRGHHETWNDVLRLQTEGREPAAFASIDVPTLMLHGAEDPHPGPEIHAHLRAHVPQIELVLLDQCGHEPWLERHARDRFFGLLRERLHGLPAR